MATNALAVRNSRSIQDQFALAYREDPRRHCPVRAARLGKRPAGPVRRATGLEPGVAAHGTVPHPRLKAEVWRQTKMTTTEKGCCRALFHRVLRVWLGMTCRRRRWHGLAQPSRGAPGTIEIRWLGNARQACISPSSRPRPDGFPFALAGQHQQAGSAMAKQPLGKGCRDFLVVRHC